MTDKLRTAVLDSIRSLENISQVLQCSREWRNMKWEHKPLFPQQHFHLQDQIDFEIRSLHRALAEPPNSDTDVVESEPVAWIVYEDGVLSLHWFRPRNGVSKVEPLYTAPPKEKNHGS